MTDLSIIIPARNEEFLARTIENILTNMRGDTEVIAICDGAWAEPQIKDHPKVNIIYHSKSVGQRAATNEGARISNAKFIMKVDAHCSFDEGFDIKLMKDCKYDWTVVPRMRNLHAFDWECTKCGKRYYQGGVPEICSNKDCKNNTFTKEIVWKEKPNATDYMWFDPDLKFAHFDSNYLNKWAKNSIENRRKYFHKYREWAKGNITDQMVCIGACWMMHRDRYWELGGMDENHGSWGQMGVELACKTWLSGGRQIVNKNTWFAHLFRTGKGFGFPYKITHKEQEKAREYSRNLWLHDNWDKAIYPLSWLIKKFSPLPGWDSINLED